MKIYVFGTRGFPGIQGGVEKHCEQLYTNLSKDIQVTVFRRKPFNILSRYFYRLTLYKDKRCGSISTFLFM